MKRLLLMFVLASSCLTSIFGQDVPVSSKETQQQETKKPGNFRNALKKKALMGSCLLSAGLTLFLVPEQKQGSLIGHLCSLVPLGYAAYLGYRSPENDSFFLPLKKPVPQKAQRYFLKAVGGLSMFWGCNLSYCSLKHVIKIVKARDAYYNSFALGHHLLTAPLLFKIGFDMVKTPRSSDNK